MSHAQVGQGTREVAPLSVLDTIRIKWRWIGASAFGAWGGAVIALFLFPSAAFGRAPAGQFRWSLVGFALLIGVLPGALQWLVLRHATKDCQAVRAALLALWIPVTGVAVSLMILPLWWVNAEAISHSMGEAALAPMLPGAALLGIAQWLLLHRTMRARWTWILLTVVGAADSEGNRPAFRFQIAHDSEMKSPTVPR